MTRTVEEMGKITISTRYYITSCSDFETFKVATHRHWSIENNLHWGIDKHLVKTNVRKKRDSLLLI